MIRVSGKEIPWREGMTVSDLLRELDDPYPYAVVRVNGRVISRPSYDTFVIPDEAEVLPIQMIAGG